MERMKGIQRPWPPLLARAHAWWHCCRGGEGNCAAKWRSSQNFLSKTRVWPEVVYNRTNGTRSKAPTRGSSRCAAAVLSLFLHSKPTMKTKLLHLAFASILCGQILAAEDKPPVDDWTSAP